MRPDRQLADAVDAAEPPQGAGVLSKGLRLLDVIAEAAAPPKLGEIARACGLPKPTVHRLLATLAEAGYVRLDGNRHLLGPRLFELANRALDGFDLREAAAPELDRLRDATGETVRLSVIDRGEALCIDQRSAPQPVRLGSGVGARVAFHASAAGKALFAHLPVAERARALDGGALPALTPNTIREPEALRRELDLVKARGYALSVDEQTPGVSAVAAPILDREGRPLGALSVSGPSYRLPSDRLHPFGRDLIEAARRASGNAGTGFLTITPRPRPAEPDRPDLRVAVPGSAFLGEGPVWSARDATLYWVDILAPAVCWSDLRSEAHQTAPMAELVGAVHPRARGGFVAATQGGVRAVDLASGATSLIVDPERDRPGNRFNDAKVDRLGRLWAGTMALDATPGMGALWRIGADGAARRMDDGFAVSNGLGWSPDDRTMYFVDSPTRRIYAYDFDLAGGEIANRRVFVEAEESAGAPDGLCVDAEGFVWVAMWDGWSVTRFDPAGAVERVVTLPVPRPTSCAFGGPDLSTLFITTARIRLSAQRLAEAPLSGSVLALETGLRGLPEPEFGG